MRSPLPTTVHPPSSATPRDLRRAAGLVTLSLVFGLIQLDASIVNVALGVLRDDLGGGVGTAQWVVDGYTLPLAAAMLTAGALGDVLGHRRICLAGIAIFGVASLGCTVAPDLLVLVMARALQGFGAAAMLPASLAMIAELYPDPTRRARALGVWGGIASLGFVTGPLLGGLLVASAGWRSVFAINIPVCVLLGLGIVELTRPGARSIRRLDIPGTVLGFAALVSVTAGIIEAGQQRPLRVMILIVTGCLLGLVFMLVERRRRDPVLPRELFSIGPLRWAIATGFGFNFVLYGLLLCVLLALQESYGLGVLTAGLAAAPLALVVGCGATFSGFAVARFGPRRPMVVGFVAAVVGALVITIGALRQDVVTIVVGLGLTGVISLAMPAMTSVALAHAPAGHAGLAGGTLNTARQLGGAVSVAVLGSILGVDSRHGLPVAALVVAVVGVGALGSAVKATGVDHDG
jgi:DHA2 family methylenomycin A resistance protein-like MFS transporter